MKDIEFEVTAEGCELHELFFQIYFFFPLNYDEEAYPTDDQMKKFRDIVNILNRCRINMVRTGTVETTREVHCVRGERYLLSGFSGEKDDLHSRKGDITHNIWCALKAPELETAPTVSSS